MIIVFLLLLPLICVLIIALNQGLPGLISAIILVVYGAALATILLLADNRSVAGDAGLAVALLLFAVALPIALKRGFLFFEGRRRRRSGFDSLLSDYGR